MQRAEINDEQKDYLSSLDAVTQPNRAEYSSPKLRIYGSIRQMTTGVGTVGTDANATKKNAQSDRATKEEIVRVGDHPLGIGLYLFTYKQQFRAEWGNGRQFGVMADEVETIMPQAVSTHADGYQVVDYALLGIFRTRH